MLLFSINSTDSDRDIDVLILRIFSDCSVMNRHSSIPFSTASDSVSVFVYDDSVASSPFVFCFLTFIQSVQRWTIFVHSIRRARNIHHSFMLILPGPPTDCLFTGIRYSVSTVVVRGITFLIIHLGHFCFWYSMIRAWRDGVEGPVDRHITPISP